MPKIDAVEAIWDALAVDPRMTEQGARLAGYVSVEMLRKKMPKDREIGLIRLRAILRAAFEEGSFERMRVGQAYWYRAKKGGKRQ